ncbi:hypothetical protein [Arthrobacter silvisoli]|uniref:hypothetical protein n=1 Tax=Arthrobacter silvisoli TaxID=2291022 RepID=UPI000E21585D|nr:hypothetical protein [Arthrobacter silvisoli]
MPDTTQPIAYLLRTLDRLLEERFTDALANHRLSRRQWQLLNVLAETQSTINQLDVATAPNQETSSREPSEASLEQLLSGGLVAEKGGVYRLTDAGRTEYRKALNDVNGVRDISTQGLENGEYERTIRTLETMINNLTT